MGIGATKYYIFNSIIRRYIYNLAEYVSVSF